MIVDTRRLFCRLLRTFEVATVCDIGSMDGTDALRFRRVLPHAAVLALEPNPRNVALMRADARLQRQDVRILPFAASDRAGEATFFVVGMSSTPGENRSRRGISSLYRRPATAPIEEVAVRTVRVDELLIGSSLRGGPLALWIDVEGAAFEVVSGAAGVLRATALIHVEVETKPIIGATQKLFADVERTLLEAGFLLLATDQRPDVLQFNALFVRADLMRARSAEIWRYATRERRRRTVSQAIKRVLPGRLRFALGLALTETRCH